MAAKRMLPDCALLNALARKSSLRNDTELDFLQVLEMLRQHVSAEVRFINQLFPEYTPHDEEYHLSRLFHVADVVLGSAAIELMGASELFVLACALYAHDWGMAVSPADRELILKGQASAVVGLLSDETARLQSFVRERSEYPASLVDPEHGPALWQEYVRATHAERSAARVRQVFETVSRGVGEAIARCCEGHWLDLELLEDPSRFPLDFSVLREPVNLRAIAIYVRLVDLLDIGEDRTPYLIWKYVAPRSDVARMEWAKHRALQAVASAPYLAGRVLVVDGGTDDPDVFAALTDLRGYCDRQLTGCLNALARTRDPNHRLDVQRLEWRIAAFGFDPLSVQFEVDRERTLALLSDEVYEHDPYVFLRELLQNSLDAIRLRDALLRGRDARLASFGTISVVVHRDEEGRFVVAWRDDGSGIDRHVLEHYVAVAGKSYYRSREFEAEFHPFTPISSFGIGLLSAFTVASTVEIITNRDPYFGTAPEVLRIVIPSIDRQFRVRRASPMSEPIGTTVRVTVDPNKLRAMKLEPERFSVRAYLARVAAFTAIPISVTEGGSSSVVRSPTSGAPHQVGGQHVDELSLGYPFEEVFLVQDLETARQCTQEIIVDLAKDLDLDGVEGSLAVLMPKNGVTYDSRYSPSVREITCSVGESNGEAMRWLPMGKEPDELATVSKSARSVGMVRLYREGMLLSQGASEQSEPSQYWPSPSLRVNFSAGRLGDVDVARTRPTSGADWYGPIEQALLGWYWRSEEARLSKMAADERYFEFGRIALAYHWRAKQLAGVVDGPLFVMPMLRNGGGFDFVSVEGWLHAGPIHVLDSDDLHAPGLLRHAEFSTRVAGLWSGGACVPTAYISLDTISSAARFVFTEFIESRTVLTGIVLLDGPFPGSYLVRETRAMRPSMTMPDVSSVASKSLDDPTQLSASDLEVLSKIIPRLCFVEFGNCPAAFCTNGGHINTKAPESESLIRLIAWTVRRQEAGPKGRDADLGIVEDFLDKIRRLTVISRQAELEVAIAQADRVSRATGVNDVGNLVRAMTRIVPVKYLELGRRDRSLGSFGEPTSDFSA